jgi:hypothetical protein
MIERAYGVQGLEVRNNDGARVLVLLNAWFM